MNTLNENKKIKAVLFDMDGTILNTEPIHKEAWTKAMRQFGHEVNFDVLYRCVGLTDALMEKLFYDELGIENFGEIYAEARKHAGVIKTNGIEVKNGFAELHNYLKQNGIKSAIVTSSTHEAAEKDLARAKLPEKAELGILNCFDLILGLGDYEKSKPAPEPYLKAVEIFGFKPDECIVAEDSNSGVISAVKAGTKCVYIKDMVDISVEVKATVFKSADSLFNIISIIKELNS